MGYLIVIAAAYLIGSSNMAYFISKVKRVDFSSQGSGNLGASNATILLGWAAGVMVAVHDIFKATLSVILAKLLFPELEYAGAAAGVAAVLGHIYPFYLKFKGGKGLASFLGMTIGLNWKLALAVCALLVIVTVITDYIVLGTFSVTAAAPVGLLFLTGNVFMMLIVCIATVVIFYKHRENMVRIRNRTEIGLRSAIKGENRIK